jgi:hypothetical protein
MGGPNLAMIEEHNHFLGARITMIALSTNDVRIMADIPGQHGRNQHPPPWRRRSTRQGQLRVCLPGQPGRPLRPELYRRLTAIDQNTTTASSGKVFRLDSKAYSAGHEDWFTVRDDLTTARWADWPTPISSTKACSTRSKRDNAEPRRGHLERTRPCPIGGDEG